VLEEPELATGPQHPPDLAQHRPLVGDAAQHQAGHGRVEHPVGGRQPLGVAVTHLHRYRRAHGVAARRLPQDGIRLNG